MALSEVLAEEIQILICSPGSHVLSEHLTPAPCGLWGWRGTWWLGRVCLLQPGDNHAVIDCSGAVMLKLAYEWEIAPKILWLDVEMITRKSLALVHAAKEGQESKGRGTRRLHVCWLEIGSTCTEAKGNGPSANSSGLEMANSELAMANNVFSEQCVKGESCSSFWPHSCALQGHGFLQGELKCWIF